MRRFPLFAVVLPFAAALTVVWPGEGSALPSYARQAGGSCMDCHSSAAPAFETLKTPNNGSSADIGLSPGGFKAGLQVHSTPAMSMSERLFTAPTDSAGESVDGKVGVDSAAAVSGYLGGGGFTASFGLQNAPAGALGPHDGSRDASLWYRFAYNPRVGAVGFSIGLFGSSSGADSASLFKKDFKKAVKELAYYSSFGVDAGADAAIGKVRLGFQTMYVAGGADRAAEGSALSGENLESPSDMLGASAKVEYGTVAGLSASYQAYDPFDENPQAGYERTFDKAATIGAWIQLGDNMIIQPQYTAFGKKDTRLNEDGEFSLRFFTNF